MCKIFSVVGMDNPKLVDDLFNTAYPIITERDNHALGYVAYNEGGSVYGERYVLNKNGEFQKKSVSTFNEFGNDSGKVIKSFMLHARFATGPKIIKNVHPFERSGNYLIHNGVVREYGLEYITSSCDSEGILNAFCDLALGYYPNRFKYLTQIIDGWYAINMFTKTKNGYVFDVFKDDRSQLHVCTIKGVSGLIYCTLKLHAEEIFKLLDIKNYTIEPVDEYKLIRHNIETGKIIKTYEAKSRTKPYVQKTYNYSNAWNDAESFDWDDYDDEFYSKADNKKQKLLEVNSENDYDECPVCKSEYVEDGYCYICGNYNNYYKNNNVDDCSLANIR